MMNMVFRLISDMMMSEILFYHSKSSIKISIHGDIYYFNVSDLIYDLTHLKTVSDNRLYDRFCYYNNHLCFGKWFLVSDDGFAISDLKTELIIRLTLLKDLE